jgi:solute:Na+ symporter, SSS family
MLPGIAAYVLHKNGHLPGLSGMDGAYSAILGFLPSGLKGLAIAALTAAIVASLAGKLNSIGTIFTLDIYMKYFKKKTSVINSEISKGDVLESVTNANFGREAEEKNMVWIGRMAALVAIVIAVVFEWKDFLGISGEGGFTFIQKYTGFISPGVFAMFILGMFWKRTTGAAAVAGLITGFAMAIFFNSFAVSVFGHENFMYTAFKNNDGVYEIPFLINMGWAFFITMAVMIGISLAGPKINPKAFMLDKTMFKLSPPVIAMIVATLLILVALYVKFW